MTFRHPAFASHFRTSQKFDSAEVLIQNYLNKKQDIDQLYVI